MKNPQQNVDLPDCQENWENVSRLLTINDTNITSINASLLSRLKYLGTLTATQQISFIMGTIAMHIGGGAQTDTTTVSHSLGVVPLGVFMPSFYSDGGHFVCHVGYGGAVPAPTSTQFQCFAWDRLGGAHGPGNLDAVPWIAIGII